MSRKNLHLCLIQKRHIKLRKNNKVNSLFLKNKKVLHQKELAVEQIVVVKNQKVCQLNRCSL